MVPLVSEWVKRSCAGLQKVVQTDQVKQIHRQGSRSAVVTRPRLILVSGHEETQNKVDGSLSVVRRLPARQVGGRSNEEAGKEGS